MIWNKQYVRNKINAFNELEQIFQKEKMMSRELQECFDTITGNIEKLSDKLKLYDEE